MTDEELEAIKADIEKQRVEDPENAAEPVEFAGYGEVAVNG